MKGYFITGTDTGCGKTYIACKLLQKYNQENNKTLGVKPVASGCIMTAKGLCNEDALQLQQHSSLAVDYSIVNPIALPEFIAPHIAASHIGLHLSVDFLLKSCEHSLAQPADTFIIEGAGGWLVPLNHDETLADFAKALNFPVILVVGLKLGCLNHSLLTFRSMQTMKINFAGWVANPINPEMEAIEQNIATLTSYLGKPLSLEP